MQHVTLDLAKDVLLNFFDRHKQINTVVYSDDLDFKALPNLTYRLAHIEHLDVNINLRQTIYNFKIVIADREDANNKKSEHEIHNDTIQIAEDFLTYFENTDFDTFEVNQTVNIQTFTESNTDRIAGVVFNVNVIAQRLRNVCAIPLKEEVVEPGANRAFTYSFPYNLE